MHACMKSYKAAKSLYLVANTSGTGLGAGLLHVRNGKTALEIKCLIM